MVYMTEKYLKPTQTIDCDSNIVREKADELTEQIRDPSKKAVKIFYFLRDEVTYNPFLYDADIEEHKASKTLERGEGYCVQKAILLAALSRAVDIPARLRFADIQNYDESERLEKLLGTNLLIYHGYDELYLKSKWIQTEPSFNIEMCEKKQIKPVEFDGKNHALFHRDKENGEPHIEYIQDRGTYADLPFKKIVRAREAFYGKSY